MDSKTGARPRSRNAGQLVRILRQHSQANRALHRISVDFQGARLVGELFVGGLKILWKEMRQECESEPSTTRLECAPDISSSIDDPVSYIEDLRGSINQLHRDKELNDVVDVETLYRGAQLARMEHLLDM